MATKTASRKGPKKPSTFTYKGIDRNGRKVSGEIHADNQLTVKSQLLKQGIRVKSINKQITLFESKKAIKPADIAVFTRQLATMLKAGVPLVQSFDIVADGLDNPSMRKLILEIKNDVASGGSLAGAMAKHPRYFDDLFCSLVESGEQSGALETMLARVATYKEKTEALKKKIKKAMTYPIMVIVVAIVVSAILLIKVVPTFAEVFSGFGADLPAFTLLVLKISDFMVAYWFIVFAIIGAALVGFREARLRSKAFSDAIDALTLKIPVIGAIVYESVIARFSRTLSTTFSAGVPLVEALESVAGAAGNAVFSKLITEVKNEVTTGTQINVALKKSGKFPNLLIQMVAIGEESGSLDEMLDKVADHYEQSVDDLVDNMSALMEPFIMAVLGVLIGGLVIAMYLPIFQLGSVV